MPKSKLITLDDLSAAFKAMSADDYSALESKYWAQHGINPEADFYPPEVTAKRFDALLGLMMKGEPLPTDLGPWPFATKTD